MSLSSLSRRRPAYTDQYPFVSGKYHIGDERVPYFSIAMTIREAHQYLRLARELAFNADEPVNFEELFQRAVDEDRAEGAISTYLQQSGSLKFFNSFTVVLLPTDPDRSSTVGSAYPDDPDAPAEPAEDGLERRSIGPVQIDELADTGIGYIRWNTKRTKAVILDGQHRFLALKKILDGPQTALLRPEETKIPVLLLVLDERAGFIGPQDQSTALQACRSIFVALNKHAIPVSKTRTYLLDDQDLISVSMRRVMTQHVGGGSNASGDSVTGIPLALVDWHSDQAKFDRTLYLTSIIALHETIRQIYPVRRDEADYEGITDFIGNVSALIEPSKGSLWGELALRNRVKKAEADGLPFIFTSEEVSAAAEAFAGGVGQAVIRPLLNLEPYKRLREAYQDAHFIGGNRELWLGFDKFGKQAYETRTGDHPYAEATRIADEVKEGDLSFTVVFQRGLLLSAVRCDIARKDFKEAWEVDSTRFSVLDEWIRRVNRRLVPRLRNIDFWLGIGIGADRNVNYTKAGANGVKGFSTLAALCPLGEIRNSADSVRSRISADAISDPGVEAWKIISDRESPYLRDDGFMAKASSHEIQFAAYEWLAEQFKLLKPGRAASLQAGVIREACIDFRNCARAYVRNELKASNTTLPDDLVLQITLVLGARRIADLAQSAGE